MNNPTFTINLDDNKKIEFNLNGGARGIQGEQGIPGISPIVTLEKEGSNLVISVTDAEGTKSETIVPGDMFKSTYDTNDNGIVDNAEKVNNHTVEIDVPNDAVFTDTLYDDTDVKNDISILQTNKADKSTTYTKNEVDGLIPDVSNFITKDVNDLTNYTKTSDLSPVATSGAYNDLTGTPDLSIYATNQALNTETTNRENADINLQGQIDAITSSSDVVDIVGTYQDLLNYDTQHLGNNDVIKVLQDSTHNDAMTYYRWLKDTSTWQYIGQEGPYYTKSEIDNTLLPYIKNTDYAGNNNNVPGIIKVYNTYGLNIDSLGSLKASILTYSNYLNLTDFAFISKGTLDNVLNAVVGDISSAIDLINGESI